MKDDLEISDIRLVIRNLITFIVIDGKKYVNDTQKRAYVSGYVNVLAKTIHLIDEKENNSLVEHIADDIEMYVE